MNLSERINVLASLGDHLRSRDEYLEAVMKRTEYNNPWFTMENQQRAIRAIADNFLKKEKLEAWIAGYDLGEPAEQKTVGLVMAGNIPLVGFHDLLCVFIAGHRARVKLSDKDRFLLPYLLRLMEGFNAESTEYVELIAQLRDFDAVIATGSNNSARYFESYFGKYPNIIRKNRNAVAVLDGTETEDELLAMGKDVFRYFGLGCRNVSKVYVPEGYDFQMMLEKLHEYRDIILHHKYKNNFDYNLALVMMNQDKFWNNGCIILTENASIASRIAMLHFEYYTDKNVLSKHLREKADQIQCVVAKWPVPDFETVPFGMAQEPGLDDYADGVDTLRFLKELG